MRASVRQARRCVIKEEDSLFHPKRGKFQFVGESTQHSSFPLFPGGIFLASWFAMRLDYQVGSSLVPTLPPEGGREGGREGRSQKSAPSSSLPPHAGEREEELNET